MIGVITGWWSGLSLRERVLVGIAGTLLGGLVGWFLIYVPLQNALASAHAAHAAALDRQAAVASRIAALTAGGRDAAMPASSAPVSQIASQAAAEAGLPLTRNDPAGNDGAAIAISAGRSAAVLAMLATLERQGIGTSDFIMRPNGDGSISLTATLRRGTGS